MADASPVTDRGSYIDNAVDKAAGKPPAKPAPPPPPTPAPPPKKNKALEDMEKAIYGGDSRTSSNTGPSGQSTDAYNKY